MNSSTTVVTCYFNIKKLKDAGYTKPFLTIEEGVKDYATNYLTKSDAYA